MIASRDIANLPSTVLVTGGAGFIASRCTELLLDRGVKVVVIDNLNDYYDVRLKTYRLRELARRAGADEALLSRFDLSSADSSRYIGPQEFRVGDLSFSLVDIENRPQMQSLFYENQFDAVLNLAARAGVRASMENPHVYMTTNVLGGLNILECMRANGCKKLVLASTSSLYAGQQMPFSEDLAVNTPISPYAASKKAAEALSYSYHHLYGIDVSVLRYFTVFGPKGRPDMSIFRFIKWIDEGVPVEVFGDGSQSRDFTYVDDIARGTIAALTRLGYEIINLGGGNSPLTINAVIRFVEDSLGKAAIVDRKPFHVADVKGTWANIGKAKRLLDWEPRISPYDGFKNTVEWYLQNRNWLSAITV